MSSEKYLAAKRARYRVDEGYRHRIRAAVYRSRGGDIEPNCSKTSYSVFEVCDLLGVSVSSFDRYQALGVIPKATYPSGNRTYWPHQVLWLIRLFDRMRREGWPRAVPHIIGSKAWSVFLSRMKDQWQKELSYDQDEALGAGNHDQV